jgi:hypothetical protein
MDVSAVRQQYGTTMVDVCVDGEFDKGGLPDSLVLTYYFTVVGGRVVQLIVISNQSTADWAVSGAESPA